MDHHEWANLDLHLYRACDPWHMDKDWKIECCEAEYEFTHVRVAHFLFRSSHCRQMVQVAVQAEVAPVLVEEHSWRCASSVSVDFLWCFFGKEGNRPIDFCEPLPGVFRSLPLPIMSGKINTLLLVFSDFAARFLEQLFHFLYCGAWKPSFGHFGHIQGKTHFGLFKLYPTSLSCHRSWYVENLQEMSCCF